MALRRILALSLTVAMIALPAATSAAAADTSGIATRTVVTTTTFDPLYGQRFVLRGQVQIISTDDAGKATYTPFPKQKVTLQECVRRCTTQTPTWKTLAATTTTDDKNALFRFSRVAYRTRVYRVVFDASKYLGIVGSSAQAIMIRTHRHVSTRLAQPTRGRFVMSGRVSPKYGGQRAALMRKTCNSCAWKVITYRATSRRGYYRFRFGTPRKTTLYVVRARASQQLAVSYSKFGRVLVR